MNNKKIEIFKSLKIPDELKTKFKIDNVTVENCKEILEKCIREIFPSITMSIEYQKEGIIKLSMGIFTIETNIHSDNIKKAEVWVYSKALGILFDIYNNTKLKMKQSEEQKLFNYHDANKNKVKNMMNKLNINNASHEILNIRKSIIYNNNMKNEVIENEVIKNNNMKNEIIENKSIEEIIENKSIEEIIENKSIEEIIENDAIEEIIENKSIEEIIENKSIEEIIENKSIEEIIENKSIEEIIENDAIEEIIENDAIEEYDNDNFNYFKIDNYNINQNIIESKPNDIYNKPKNILKSKKNINFDNEINNNKIYNESNTLNNNIYFNVFKFDDVDNIANNNNRNIDDKNNFNINNNNENINIINKRSYINEYVFNQNKDIKNQIETENLNLEEDNIDDLLKGVIINKMDDGFSKTKKIKKMINNDKESINKFKNLKLLTKGDFEKLIKKHESIEFQYFKSLRIFCTNYKIYPPEFEIIRENDVYRCTGIFNNINFVSSYEYDKSTVKEETCKKIYDYIFQNWNKLTRNI